MAFKRLFLLAMAGFLFSTVQVQAGGNDTDGDGILDNVDNCLDRANADQRDTNGDGIGNACDPDLNDDCRVNFADLQLFSQVLLVQIGHLFDLWCIFFDGEFNPAL